MDPERELRELRELQKTANRTARPRQLRATGGGDGLDGGGTRRSRMSTTSRRRDYALGSDESGGEVNSDSDNGGGRKAQTSGRSGGEYVADDFVVSDEDDADEGGSPTGGKWREAEDSRTRASTQRPPSYLERKAILSSSLAVAINGHTESSSLPSKAVAPPTANRNVLSPHINPDRIDPSTSPASPRSDVLGPRARHVGG